MQESERLNNEELISAYLDGELSGDEQERAERLLRENPECRQAYDELCALRETLQSLPAERLDGDFYQRVLRQAERASLQGDSTGTDAGASAAGTIDMANATGKPWRRIFWVTAATAAAIALMFLPRITDQGPELSQHHADSEPAPAAEVTNNVLPDHSVPDHSVPDHSVLSDEVLDRRDVADDAGVDRPDSHAKGGIRDDGSLGLDLEHDAGNLRKSMATPGPMRKGDASGSGLADQPMPAAAQPLADDVVQSVQDPSGVDFAQPAEESSPLLRRRYESDAFVNQLPPADERDVPTWLASTARSTGSNFIVQLDVAPPGSAPATSAPATNALFDEALFKNQIAYEQPPADIQSAPTRRLLSQSGVDESSEKEFDESVQGVRPTVDEAAPRSQVASGDARDATDKLFAEGKALGEPVELVVVDAPPAQIAATIRAFQAERAAVNLRVQLQQLDGVSQLAEAPQQSFTQSEPVPNQASEQIERQQVAIAAAPGISSGRLQTNFRRVDDVEQIVTLSEPISAAGGNEPQAGPTQHPDAGQRAKQSRPTFDQLKAEPGTRMAESESLLPATEAGARQRSDPPTAPTDSVGGPEAYVLDAEPTDVKAQSMPLPSQQEGVAQTANTRRWYASPQQRGRAFRIETQYAHESQDAIESQSTSPTPADNEVAGNRSIQLYASPEQQAANVDRYFIVPQDADATNTLGLLTQNSFTNAYGEPTVRVLFVLHQASPTLTQQDALIDDQLEAAEEEAPADAAPADDR